MNRLKTLAFQALLLSMAGSATACTVPVFRYALERWPPDPHVMTVSKDIDFKAVRNIIARQHANIWVEPSQAGQDDEVRIFYSDFNSHWHDARWDSNLVSRVCDSPLRRAIAQELVTGRTAVWILLKGNNEATNALVSQMVDTQLEEMEELMKLPEELDYEDEEDGYTGPQSGASLSKVPVKIDFSLRELSRTNKQEEFFIKQIEGEGENFANPENPVAVAIYGQGRMIPITGIALQPETIREICAYLAGECSCRVKALNPGRDVLMAANWSDAIFDYPEPAVTRLPGGETFMLGGASRTTDVEGVMEVASEETPAKESGFPVTGALAVGLSVLVLATLVITIVRK